MSTAPDEPLDDILPGLDRSPRPARARRRGHWIDQLSIYLPVLLMGLLALASYWLLRATPAPSAPAAPAPLTGEPDYTMRGFSVKSFLPDGRLQAEVAGDEARHHPDDDRVEIDNARIRRVDEQGLVTIASARRVITNGDNTRYLLEGDAVVIHEAATGADGVARPRLEFRGQRLEITLDPDRVRSDSPVELRRGNDRLTADSLDYRDDTRTADFRGRVRVQMLP